jgi:hypothetical protein
LPTAKPAAVESDAAVEEEAITLPVQRGLNVAKVVRRRRGCRIMVVWYRMVVYYDTRQANRKRRRYDIALVSSCENVVLPHSI